MWIISSLYVIATLASTAWGRYQTQWYLSKGVSTSSLGVLRGVGSATKGIAYPMWGYLSDRIGMKMTLLASIVASTMMLEVHRHDVVFAHGMMLLCFLKVLRSGSNSVWVLIDTFNINESAANPKSHYGMQRLWCAVAWGVGAFGIGAYLDSNGLESMFSISYLLTAVMVALVIAFLPDDSRSKKLKPKLGFFASVKQILATDEHHSQLKFYGVVFAHGFCVSVCETTLYVALSKEWSASNTLVGGGVFVSVMLEIPVYFFSKRLLEKYSSRNLVLMAQMMMALRLFGTSLVTRDTVSWILPLQILHGPVSAGAWAAFVSHSSALAPPDLRGTSQTVLSAVYVTLGIGVGSACWGFVMEAHGANTTFALAGACSLLAMLVSSALMSPPPKTVIQLIDV